MSHGSLGNQAQGASAMQVTQPELGRLKAAAERIGMAANRASNFIERFDGPIGAGVSGDTDKPPSTYRNDLDSLFTEIERLEIIIAQLDHIG
jgi:hypothetical protein